MQEKPINETHQLFNSVCQSPSSLEILPEEIPIHTVYEDEHLLVVNKPPGMLVHPIGKKWSGTLANALIWRYRELPVKPGNEDQPGLVHRIDKGTSGLLVVAKTAKVLRELVEQFYQHTVERTYLALIWGTPTPTKGTINVNLGRMENKRRITTVVYPEGEKGKTAITHYQVLRTYGCVSLIQCNLETGRTHQIRAHMSYLGHPLFNDRLYNGSHTGPADTDPEEHKKFIAGCYQTMKRHALHAKTLGFLHPITREKMHFDSELPEDFQALLNEWGKYTGR